MQTCAGPSLQGTHLWLAAAGNAAVNGAAGCCQTEVQARRNSHSLRDCSVDRSSRLSCCREMSATVGGHDAARGKDRCDGRGRTRGHTRGERKLRRLGEAAVGACGPACQLRAASQHRLPLVSAGLCCKLPRFGDTPRLQRAVCVRRDGDERRCLLATQLQNLGVAATTGQGLGDGQYGSVGQGGRGGGEDRRARACGRHCCCWGWCAGAGGSVPAGQREQRQRHAVGQLSNMCTGSGQQGQAPSVPARDGSRRGHRRARASSCGGAGTRGHAWVRLRTCITQSRAARRRSPQSWLA